MTASVVGIADSSAFGGSLRVVVTRPEALAAARAAVDKVVAEMDIAASRFRDDSELSRLNASQDRVTKISPLLAEAIAAALRGAELSDGAVDPTIGAAIRVAGYDSDFASVAMHGGPLRLIAHRVPGWRVIRLSAGSRTVLLPRGVELDLGATAKALTADLAARAALEAAGGGALVSLGGDIAVAGDAPDGGWRIQASEDSAAPLSDRDETISITSGGVATSGTTVRRWRRGGAVLHHIIDPTTGLPVQTCWRIATVIAGSAVDANIASTAAIVMGEAAAPWLAENHLAARLVHRDGSVRRLAGWPLQPARSSSPLFSEQFPRNPDQHEPRESGQRRAGARRR
ncbi:MAG TPA: FAD:protein FMN transferase [Candidatus Dormibacteraeota bacterium]|nr:FAD:protein FMN transferase [Candidatus Dormibacteraeota bacterium]